MTDTLRVRIIPAIAKEGDPFLERYPRTATTKIVATIKATVVPENKPFPKLKPGGSMNTEKQKFPVTLPDAPEISHEHVNVLKGKDKQWIRVVSFVFRGTPKDKEAMEVIIGSAIIDDDLLEHDTELHYGFMQKDDSVIVKIPIFDPDATHIQIKPTDEKRFVKKLWRLPPLQQKRDTVVDIPVHNDLASALQEASERTAPMKTMPELDIPISDGDPFADLPQTKAPVASIENEIGDIPELHGVPSSMEAPPTSTGEKPSIERFSSNDIDAEAAAQEQEKADRAKTERARAEAAANAEIAANRAREEAQAAEAQRIEERKRLDVKAEKLKAQVLANAAANAAIEANRVKQMLEEAEAQRVEEQRRIEAEAEAERARAEAAADAEIAANRAREEAQAAEAQRVEERKRLEAEAEDERRKQAAEAFTAEAVAAAAADEAPQQPAMPADDEELNQVEEEAFEAGAADVGLAAAAVAPVPTPKEEEVKPAEPKSPLNKGASGTSTAQKKDRSPWLIGAAAGVLLLLAVGIYSISSHHEATQVATVTEPAVPVVTPPATPVVAPVVAPVAPVVTSTSEVIEGCEYALYGKERRGRRLTSGGVFFSCPSVTDGTVIAKINKDGMPLREGMQIVKILVSQN